MGWTQFHDMHSGGYRKHSHNHIFVEAPTEKLAREVFTQRFSDPDDVACDCCGSNFAVTYSDTLEDATWYERGCALDENDHVVETQDPTRLYAKYRTLAEYMASGEALFVKWDAAVDEGAGI